MRMALAVLVLSVSPSFGQANFYGRFTAEVAAPAEGCPASLVRAGVQDTEAKPTGAKIADAIAGSPVPLDGSYHAGTVRFDVTVQAGLRSISAIEVEWTALNAFDEPVGTRRMSITWKEGLTAGKKRVSSISGYRIAEDVSKYRVAIVRVKLIDGTFWPANIVPAPVDGTP